ncbi:hypothetical protein [Bacillus kexueae]|uniref:hypothetical protein n=1 Tax=Aeribacillus kexueae TaxID=2078952 RepID=UPI001FAFF283|nr:hypothetical protein [Bacillus kexueae]
MIYVILSIIAASAFLALRFKKPQFLLIPILSIFIYFIVEIALVPAPFFDTLKFIFSLS